MLSRLMAQGGQSRLTPDEETKLSAWLEGRFDVGFSDASRAV